MIRIFLFSLLVYNFVLADTTLVEPKPSIFEQRKIVLSISSGNPVDINHILGSANNILKFYGPEKVQMVIVAYYHGIESVLKRNKKIAKRVEALQLYDVEFIACENTMRSKKLTKDDLLEDVSIATAGLVEIIERQKAGYININP